MLRAFNSEFAIRNSHCALSYEKVYSYVQMHYRPWMAIWLDGKQLPQSYMVKNIRILEIHDDSMPQQQCLRGSLLHNDSLATFETRSANGDATIFISGTDMNSRLMLPISMLEERVDAEGLIYVPQKMSNVPFSIPNEFIIALLLIMYRHPYHGKQI